MPLADQLMRNPQPNAASHTSYLPMPPSRHQSLQVPMALLHLCWLSSQWTSVLLLIDDKRGKTPNETVATSMEHENF